ncbi:MAG: phosphonate monoester hydrolase, partial [Acidimicrobiales bacterium]|nr:phosphonate monoester hydrolase [Acidimicrobiales bacterium]
RHYSQASPCSPGRACLYTGMYQMNTRVVANGTPLDARFDNVALAARRAGYAPALFGYTDQSVDPREASGPDDPRMHAYTGVLPGFDPVLALDDDQVPWREWLVEHGYEDPGSSELALRSEPDRPVELGVSTFVTDAALGWLDARTDESPWFIHLSYLRPHPPYAAAGEFATMYDPADVGLPIAPTSDPHPYHARVLARPGIAAPTDEAEIRHLRAQYYGMISEVDAQLGRVWAELRERGLWDSTLIVVTADHGEQLGDHGLLQKLGFFEQSYHVLGIIRDPRHPDAHGTVVEQFTENIDIFPTICDAIGIDVPGQCDGLPLTPFLRGQAPPWWRDAAHWEFDWRFLTIGRHPHPWPWDRALEQRNLSVRRDADVQYVQFGDGSWLCFDLAADPTARTTIDDPAIVLDQAQKMLVWRANHLDRTLTDMLVESGGIGRLPPGVPATFQTS